MKSLLLALLVAFNANAAGIRAYFSPDGGCTEAVTAELSRAKSSILVQAYSFTSAPIAKALVDAHPLPSGRVASVICRLLSRRRTR